jgi:hypothetical protein
MPQYKAIFKYAPQALRAYLSTDLAKEVTIRAIAQQLLSDKCSHCH